MKKIKNIINITNNTAYDLCADYIPEYVKSDALFLDLETTGFTPAKSKLYLVGTAYFENDSLITEQFFAESKAPDEERKLLASLDELLSKFHTIITFHGNQFDLPFLRGCKKRLGTDFLHTAGNRVDLYQHFHAYKHIFSLENYKQRSFESFLGIKREDTYTGGELIKVYEDYIKNPDDNCLCLLLQHNYEDLLGMVQLVSLYAFDSFFDGHFVPVSTAVSVYRKMDGTKGLEFIISCRIDNQLPAAITCNNNHFYLHTDQNYAAFRIPLLQGELKYFFPNYKDYFYLPDEDRSIHKSVAAYVDKAHRQKSRASNCYSKKTGIFLPQYEEVITPAFYTEYKSKISYFELPEYFQGSSTDYTDDKLMLLKNYCMHILKILKTGIS